MGNIIKSEKYEKYVVISDLCLNKNGIVIQKKLRENQLFGFIQIF